MGGVWERQIRSIRSVLTSLMNANRGILDDESLTTLMAEAECIINSRPLSVDTISDPTCMLPIYPMQLLTLKTEVVLAPPGNFTKNDVYCRRRWRRVQHLANEFWSRWSKEYLTSLQSRQKWNKRQRNFKVGDVVLLIHDSQSYSERNAWPMAVITKVYPGSDGNI